MWGRIYDIWTGDESVELRNMIDEFRLDYALDEKFMISLDLIESAIHDLDYDHALTLFLYYQPVNMRPIDFKLFEKLLTDAQYGI